MPVTKIIESASMEVVDVPLFAPPVGLEAKAPSAVSPIRFGSMDYLPPVAPDVPEKLPACLAVVKSGLAVGLKHGEGMSVDPN